MEDRITPAGPVITQFLAAAGIDHMAYLSGSVQDDNSTNVTVSISGVASGSVQTDSTGHFDFVTSATSLGTVNAVASDSAGLSSATVSAQLTSQAPAITLSVAYGTGRTVTLSGAVTDWQSGGVPVTFSGVVAGSTVTNSDGTFSYTAQASDLGDIQATATDSWGLVSNTCAVTLTNQAPVISLSFAQGAGKSVTLSGTVTDESPGSLTVTLSGVVNATVTTNTDGSFSLTTDASGLGAIQASTVDPWGAASNTAEVTVASQPPTISLGVTQGSGTTVTLSGSVSADSPGGLTVTFSGAVTGTTTTNSDGTYSYTTQANSLGTINASTTDSWGQASNIAPATIASQPPTITLALTYGEGRTVTLSGTVSADSPGGLTVALSGVASGTVTTNADGSFSITVQASALGTIQASTTDVWGQASNVAQVTVTSNAPTISNFQVIVGPDGLYTFEGQVTDESAVGLTVQLGGIASLTGATVTVNDYGSFSLTLRLQQGESGTATAQATDWWGLQSNVATTYVD